jgi:CO dehydrogenase/acetyl-CoA synthase delta subunit
MAILLIDIMGAMGSGTFAPRHSVANIVIGKDSNSSTMIRNLRSPIFKIMMIMRLILIGTDLMMYMLGVSLSQKK